MILYNEKFVTDDTIIQIEDRGYQFGDGVYEVIRIYNGKCFELDNHLERMVSSARKIKLSLPYSIFEIKKNLMELVNKEEILDGKIYIQITRGKSVRKHHLPKEPSPILIAYVEELPRPFKKIQNGVNAILSEDIRWTRCDIKSLNLLGNVLLKQEAKDNNCEEAILHRNKIITEGSSTNVFIVKNSKIQTHPENNFILNGITRQKIINIAHNNNFIISEEAFTIEELLNADEVFITSTTLELIPIIKVDNKVIGNGFPGTTTQKFQNIFNEEISKI